MTHDPIEELLDGNRKWSENTCATHPEFFEQLARGQSPRFLWIGCSDSRVPATEICGLKPGSVFVHRNIANLVSPHDLNFMSVLQYAVDVLQVIDILVCGHHDCGGVRVALEGGAKGRIGEWLRPLSALAKRHAEELAACPAADRARRLCEWNVIEQVRNISGTSIVRDAWARGQELNVHALVYRVEDGLLKDLCGTVARGDEHALETPDGEAL